MKTGRDIYVHDMQPPHDWDALRPDQHVYWGLLASSCEDVPAYISPEKAREMIDSISGISSVMRGEP